MQSARNGLRDGWPLGGWVGTCPLQVSGLNFYIPGRVEGYWVRVKLSDLHKNVGGAVASWLVRSTPERAVRVRALAGDVVFLGKTLYSHSASLHPGV